MNETNVTWYVDRFDTSKTGMEKVNSLKHGIVGVVFFKSLSWKKICLPKDEMIFSVYVT